MTSSINPKSVLGISYLGRTTVSGILLAVVLFFYIFTIGSFLKIGIFPFINRITYQELFNFFIVNEYFDHLVIAIALLFWFAFSFLKKRITVPIIIGLSFIIGISHILDFNQIVSIIALLSVPVIFFVILFNKFATNKILYDQNFLFINYLSIIGIIIGISSLVVVLNSILQFSIESLIMRNYLYEIYLMFSSFSNIYIVLLISCVPIKLLIDYVKTTLKIKSIHIFPENGINRSSKILFLLGFMLLSITLSLIPHSEIINEDNQNVGVDTGYYVIWIESMIDSQDSLELLREAFVLQNQGDRPISLLLIFTIMIIGNMDLEDAAEISPVLLGPGLVLGIYFLTRELTSNDRVALLASFLTAVSFQTLGGIYAGYYANWLSLIIGYFTIAFLIKSLKTTGKIYPLIFFILLILTLLSHVYTWTILIVVIILFLAVLLKLKTYEQKRILLLLLLVAISISFDVGRTTITGASGGIEQDIGLAIEDVKINFDNFATRWSTLSYNTTIILGGMVGNFIILTLALYWLFWSKLREPHNIFLIIFFSVGFIPILLGDWAIQNKILYDIPFQIPAAIALIQISKQIKANTVLIATCICLFALAVRDASNFYFNFN